MLQSEALSPADKWGLVRNEVLRHADTMVRVWAEKAACPMPLLILLTRFIKNTQHKAASHTAIGNMPTLANITVTLLV